MKISVLTPTYNRGNLLENLYKSLLENQKFGIDIEWLIMDDGSNDNTKQVVEKMQDELAKYTENVQNKKDENIETRVKRSENFEIKYFYQENQGKMVAINNLVEKSTGDLIVDCDSDDWFTPNAFEIIKNSYEKNQKDLGKIYAFCFLKYDSKGNNMGCNFSKERTTMFDLYFKEGETGEKALVFIADVRKKYKHKLENGEKFVTEARLYHEMDLNYKMICVNEPIMICEYQEGGYTNNITKQFKENPYGYFEYFKEILSSDMNGVKFNKRLYAIKHYILFGYLTKKHSMKYVKGFQNKLMYFVLFIPRNIEKQKVLNLMFRNSATPIYKMSRRGTNMKNIMLCLNQMGIGGVETAALNQTIQLIKKGYNVIVLAKDGIYKEIFEEEGAICVNFEYEVSSSYNNKKIVQIGEIIKKYNIEQVHIHQFDCINSVFPACILENIPFVAYAHTGITGIFDWFEDSYKGYENIFKLYFECCKKIITITEQAKQEIIQKYSIKEDKILIINNSIDFEKISSFNNKMPDKIENILIVSRFSQEKMESIKNGIELFKTYLDINANAKLTIVGDGECKKDVQKIIEKLCITVEMLGQRNDIMEIMTKHDMVIALDRCALESIAMKKICIISGYDGIKGLITPERVKEFAYTNFSGRGLENKDINNVIEEIKNLNEEKIKNIVSKNYEFAFENLNAEKNLYIIEDKENVKDIITFMNTVIKLQNLYSNRIQKEEKDWKEWEDAKKWFEGQIELERKKTRIEHEENEKLKKELEEIYSSKTWKIFNKFKKNDKK